MSRPVIRLRRHSMANLLELQDWLAGLVCVELCSRRQHHEFDVVNYRAPTTEYESGWNPPTPDELPAKTGDGDVIRISPFRIMVSLSDNTSE
jgi:hypothetical protein